MGYGDELMLAGRARVRQQTDPRKCRVTYQGVQRWSQWASVWENNPRIARMGEAGDFQELQARDAANNRPYHTGKMPQQWSYNLTFRPDVGEFYFTEAEREFGARHAGQIIVEPHIKPGASPNKDWGFNRWTALVALMNEAGVHPIQIGQQGTRVVDGAGFVLTPSFRMAAAVLARSRAAVLHEGGLHHAAAAVGLPAVVIFGGFTPVELTGYPMHRNLGVSLGDACGMRQACKHCSEAMAAITPEHVFDELRALLNA